MYTLGWLILFVLLLIVEILTMGLTTIWFAAGALVAILASVIGFSLPVQVIVFLIVSVVTLILTRPLVMKYFNKDRLRTNADRLIGQQAVVLEEIDTLRAKGRVEINGQEWSAKTSDPDMVIPEGRTVLVEAIQGVKLVVKE
ncbi:MAG: NfeD family protein [Eubacteriales bacterium]|nr:NfeD family protein [Eubacteriales bacterium]